jgi:hypothetical protein
MQISLAFAQSHYVKTNFTQFDSHLQVYVAAGANLLQVSASGGTTPAVRTIFTVPNAGQRGVGVLGVTPSADASVLYINGATQGLFAIGLDGSPVWKNANGR